MKEYNQARFLFTLEAGILPWVTTAAGGSYLAGFLAMLGASDALSGVLLSVISVAALMQIYAPILSQRVQSPKLLATLLIAISRLCLVVMLLLPACFGVSPLVLIVSCVLYVIWAILSNLYIPLEATWLTSVLPLPIRGKFFGTKDAFTYISTAIASYAVGVVLDFYEVSGALRSGFFAVGIAAAVFWLADFVCHLNICAPQTERNAADLQMKTLLKKSFGSRRFYKLIKVTLLYDIAIYLSSAYISIYVVTNLHVSYGFISIMTLVCVGVKALLAPIWGRYASRTSFHKSSQRSMLVMMVAFVLWALMAKENAGWMYPLAMLVLSIAQSGAMFSIYGIKFDLAPAEDQEIFISVGNAVSGGISFLIAFAASAFVGVSGQLSVNLGFVSLCNMQLLFLMSALFSAAFCLYLGKLMKKA